MRTIEIKLYGFNELSAEAKKVAIEEHRGVKQEWDVLDGFKENAIEQIKEAGFTESKLQYSLSNSQGDGLSFSADGFDGDKLKDLFRKHLGDKKEKTINEILNYCSFKLTGNSGNHYCYASKRDLTFEFDDFIGSHVQVHTVVSQIEKDLQDIYLSLCKVLEKQGYEELEYQYSDECITEDFEANEYEFKDTGNKFR